MGTTPRTVRPGGGAAHGGGLTVASDASFVAPERPRGPALRRAGAPLIDLHGGVLFRWQGGAGVARVEVAGSFSEWTPIPMAPVPDLPGLFELEMALAPGRHQYKFVVDGTWTSMPGCPTMDDGFGALNNVLEVPSTLTGGALSQQARASGGRSLTPPAQRCWVGDPAPKATNTASPGGVRGDLRWAGG